MTRRAYAFHAAFLSLIAVACGSNQSGGTNPPPPCPNPKTSGAWQAQVLNFSYSDSLKGCPLALGRVDSLRVTDAMLKLYFEPIANNSFDMEGGYFELWRLNTALTNGGAGVGPIKQDSGGYTSHALTFTGPFSHSGHPHGVWERPMTFWIGWPREGTKFEAESLYVKYDSRVSWPTLSPDSVYFGPTQGRLITVATVKRDENPGVIQGDAVVTPNVGQNWSVTGENRIGAYRYRWYVDGVLQPNDTSYFYWREMNAGGAFTLRADQILIDTTYVLLKNVSAAPMYLSISGPTVVLAYTSNLYSAVPSSGTSPYTYAWTVDGSPAGSGGSIYSPAWEPWTSHEISVAATDNIGRVGTANIIVNSNSECGLEVIQCFQLRQQAPLVPKKPSPTSLTWWRMIPLMPLMP